MAFANIFKRRAPAEAPAPAREGELVLTLSTPPPSLNNCFHNVPGVGRVKTKRYRAWIRNAGNEILYQRAAPMKGPVFVLFEIGERGTRADADNLIKALFDLLVSLRLIEADSKKCVRGYSVRWVHGARLVRVAIVSAA
jgi:Holliday junction resolvase RusA-like endonuclease